MNVKIIAHTPKPKGKRSALMIEIALEHYYAIEPELENTPAHKAQAAELAEAGLLIETDDTPSGYRRTEALLVYIDALKAVPFPVPGWVMPE